MCVAKEGGKALMDEEKTTAGSLALQERQPRVITIAAAQQPEDIKLRVAAYARVSSSSEDQLNSFAAQNRYYTTLISGKESWAMVDIYADEGITGTSAEKREDFQRLKELTPETYAYFEKLSAEWGPLS